MQTSVAVAVVDSAIVDGMTEQLNPIDGEIVTPRFTFPTKPPVLFSVIVEVPLEPLLKFNVVGSAEIVKSGIAWPMLIMNMETRIANTKNRAANFLGSNCSFRSAPIFASTFFSLPGECTMV